MSQRGINKLKNNRQAIPLICVASILASGCLTQTFADEAIKSSINTEFTMKQESHPISHDDYSVLKEPKTVEELLLNLKYVYEHDWLLNADFYAVSILKHIIGGDSKDLHTNYVYLGKRIDHFVENGSIHSSGNDFKYFQRSSDKEAHLMVEDVRATYGKKGGSISLWFKEGAVSFEQVEKLFGKGWEFDQNPPPEGWTPPPRTSLYGNALISYKKDTGKLEKFMGLWTRYDGSIYELSFQIEEKK